MAWVSYQMRKIAVCACDGNAGNVFPATPDSDPNMHNGACMTHAPWCMQGSLTSGFYWSRWWWKRSRHSRCMRNPQFSISGKLTAVWSKGVTSYSYRGFLLSSPYLPHPDYQGMPWCIEPYVKWHCAEPVQYCSARCPLPLTRFSVAAPVHSVLVYVTIHNYKPASTTKIKPTLYNDGRFNIALFVVHKHRCIFPRHACIREAAHRSHWREWWRALQCSITVTS